MTGPIAAPARDPAVDIARGIAIIAIVVGHVWRGMASAGVVASDDTYRLVDNGLYFFHLAVFVFVSGLFVRASMVKRGTVPYLRQRLWLFIYLYLVWSVLQGVVKVASVRLVNTPVSWADVFTLWVPEGQLWYLPFMAQMTLLVVILQPWRRGRRFAGMALASAVSILLWGFEGPWAGTRGLSLTVFFILGAVVGAPRMLQALDRVRPGAATAGLVTALVGYAALLGWTVAIPPTVGEESWTLEAVLLGGLATLLSSAAVVLLARLLAALPGVGASLAFMGRVSLEIFLAHIIAASGTRIVLQQVGVVSVGAHLIAGTVAGLLSGMILWWLAQRWLPLGWLVTPPSLDRR